MLNGQGSQMCVWHEIADRPSLTEHSLKNRPVLVARMNQPQARLIEPALDPIDGFPHCERALM